MKPNTIFTLSTVILLVSFGCTGLFKEKKVKVPPGSYDVTPAPLVIGAGDVIAITSFTEKLPTGEFSVNEQGTITYPFVGTIGVIGKKPDEVRRTIIEKLKDGFFRNPVIYVSFKLNKSQTITVFGFVKNPGSFVYEPQITILEILAKSGGLLTTADNESITVIRKQLGRNLRIKVSVNDITEGKTPNFKLLPGDLIVVPERFL
ncbi:polysaccharide export protein [Myxococcota bacterium]|nr:polysaccharide export protein [Myxococcota bacterium]MBU1382523.1 polysaccharide export protein [Myxococcota bacterium]MBU1497215.1 polysaccharide export protein [Myxococcota bacterium]